MLNPYEVTAYTTKRRKGFAFPQEVVAYHEYFHNKANALTAAAELRRSENNVHVEVIDTRRSEGDRLISGWTYDSVTGTWHNYLRS